MRCRGPGAIPGLSSIRKQYPGGKCPSVQQRGSFKIRYSLSDCNYIAHHPRLCRGKVGVVVRIMSFQLHCVKLVCEVLDFQGEFFQYAQFFFLGMIASLFCKAVVQRSVCSPPCSPGIIRPFPDKAVGAIVTKSVEKSIVCSADRAPQIGLLRAAFA